jgi:hypothetical protein
MRRKEETPHSGWHVNNLTLAQDAPYFSEIFEEVAKKLRALFRELPEAKVSIVLLCNKGWHRSESVRCGLIGALKLAGAQVSDSKPLSLIAWERAGCRRCYDSKYPMLKHSEVCG